MACILKPDLTNACDFVAPVGAQVDIVVKATAPVTIFEAKFNGAVLTLSPDRTRTSFTMSATGGALLIQLTIAPGDTAQILEDCGPSITPQVIGRATPANPTQRITICPSTV